MAKHARLGEPITHALFQLPHAVLRPGGYSQVTEQRILIVDDHAIVREGLRFLLKAGLGPVQIDEAESGKDAIAMLRNGEWDILLLDISLPGRSGLDLLRDIRSSGFSLPVLVLSMHSEELYGVRAMRAGAAGYLTKDTVPKELVTAVRKILNGGRYISDSLAQCLAQELNRPAAQWPHERLSDRELDVFRMIASGLTVSQIADRMCLSVKTVSTYRARILDKMAMKTNAEITHYAFAHGVGVTLYEDKD